MSNYSQEDAQFMADWFNLINQLWIGTGKVSKEIKKEFEKADEIRIKLHQKVFSNQSNWKASFNKKHKLTISWQPDLNNRLQVVQTRGAK
jgi:uncharacterized protein Yka (UPF0111/DUF47 family)|tara:strand:+ start:2210 stop:2479 length:270 start_codon:yes stop_codon:yes gene_type:complete